MKTAPVSPPAADHDRSAADCRNSLRLILLATLPVLVILAVQWAVWPILEPCAWSLLCLAVYLSSWFGGLRAGLAATALATLWGWYFLIPFERAFVVERASDGLSIGIFLIIALLFSFLPARWRRANDRATAAATSLQVTNEQLEARVRERTEEVERIHTELREDFEILKKIIATQDEISAGVDHLDTQLNLLVGRSQELTKADGAAFEQLEGNTLVYRVASGIAAQQVGLRLGRTSSFSGECLRTDETLTCDDAETDPRVDLAACRRVGLRSMLVMPLRAKGEGPKGVLKVLSARPGAFGARDLRTLHLMGALFVTAMSLAARQKSEQQFRETENRFRLLADSAPVLIWVNGLDGCEFVNRAYLEFVGVQSDVEVRGYDWSQFVHPEDRESYVTAYLDSMKRQAPFEAKFRFRRHDGGYRWMKSVAGPRFDHSGVLIGYVGSTVDVNDLQQATQELEENRHRLASIVQSAMDAIVTVDEDQCVVLFNSAAEKMFGCTAEEALGSPLDRFIPVRFRQRHRQHVRGFGKTGTTSRAMGALGALSALRDRGEEFPIEASISKVEVSGRKLFTVILRDVTERTRAEAATALRTRQQEAVADLSRHALLGRDLHRLMTDAVALVAQVLGVEFAEMLELTPTGDKLFLRAGVGWHDGLVGSRTVGAGRESQAGYTLLCNAPAVVENLPHETRFHGPPLLIEHEVVSGMTVVLRGRVRPYGVLGAHTTSQRAFSNDDVHFLQSVADILAATIERHQIEDELLATTGREQRRIGQDLHDGLCQHLVGIEFRIEALARDLADTPMVREEVEKIGALVRDSTRQARMLARGLAPVELEKNGLMSALNELATNSAHLFRIECHFLCEQPVLVADEATATHLYRIAQEALSNAVRHARAKTIEIALRPAANEEAVLTVTNDGAPLPEKPGRGGGMGLRIMNYRAELIGATLRLGSAADGKTEIACTFKPR